MKTPIASLSIAARATLNMHSLNNEGGEGNQIQTRMAGILVTEGRSTPRKSVSEFGWILGIPDRVQTDTYLHVKYVSERGSEKRAEDAEGQKTGANLGQSIFHRPASSGIYAIVCHLELSRIGYNDIRQDYALTEHERQVRSSLLLESLLHTFIELNGAMRSTQLPHLVALQGVITISTGITPAPLISPLIGGPDDQKTYREQVASIVTALNGSQQPTVNAQNFDTISDFATQMRVLIDSTSPFELNVAY